MNRDETNGLLGLLSEYWGNFEMTDSKVGAWADALRSYTKHEAWAALKELRTEPERRFAPTISELIGKIDQLRGEARRREKVSRLLTAPAQVYDVLETYPYSSGNLEVRKAVRCTKSRREEIHERMTAQGYVKDSFYLTSGQKVFRYVKA
jgi:hypothetical protein